jgi:hypothetical protein
MGKIWQSILKWVSRHPWAKSSVLFLGARIARTRRWLANRNLFTLSGIIFGSLSFIATAVISVVPIFMKSDELLASHGLPTHMNLWFAVLSINLGWIVTGAYLYQFAFKSIRASRVDKGARRHDLNRKLIERTYIGDVHHRLESHARLSEAPRIIEAVLEAIKSKVAEKLGSYGEQSKLEANLLIQPGDKLGYLRVIARHGNTRACPMDYSFSERSFCAEIWKGDKTSAAAGNIRVISPETAQGVSYRDILRIPVLGFDGEPVAAVSIDSVEAYYFPRSADKLGEIDIEISPYVAMLRLILAF